MKILPLIVILLLPAYVLAQADVCPRIVLHGPSGVTRPGEAVTFTAAVVATGEEKLDLEYVWEVSGGEIVSGQGTEKIAVKQRDDRFTATVTVRGLPGTCPKTASENFCAEPLPQATLIETFNGPLRKLDAGWYYKTYDALRNDPTAHVVILIRGTLRQIRAKKQAIMKSMPFDGDRRSAGRVTFVDGPDKPDSMEVWLVPAGARGPTP